MSFPQTLAKARDAFITQAQARGAPVVLLDVPLLFETRGERQCDAVVVVSAPPDVQRRRALERPGMTAPWDPAGSIVLWERHCLRR
jgi:dephospho-CoA kinase